MDSSSREAPACVAASNEDYVTRHHVIAVFLILAASLAGTLLPLLGKHLPSLRVHDFVFVLGKSLATGVVLGVALVHMLQPAEEALANECVPQSFRDVAGPAAYVICLAAILLMQTVEVFLKSLITHCLTSHPDGGDREAEDDAVEVTPFFSTSTPTPPAPQHTHSHFVDHVDLTADTSSNNRVQRVMAAVLLEFGVSLHSIFVGLTVGVCAEAELPTLLTALCLHQFFEGVALGARLAEADFNLSVESVFALVFTLSAPIGAALGVGITSSGVVNMSSAAYLLAQGCLDAFCAGILLYLGFGLLLADFPRDMGLHCTGSPLAAWRRAGMMLALWLGGAIMAFIGRYL